MSTPGERRLLDLHIGRREQYMAFEVIGTLEVMWEKQVRDSHEWSEDRTPNRKVYAQKLITNRLTSELVRCDLCIPWLTWGSSLERYRGWCMIEYAVVHQVQQVDSSTRGDAYGGATTVCNVFTHGEWNNVRATPVLMKERLDVGPANLDWKLQTTQQYVVCVHTHRHHQLNWTL